MTTAPAPCRRAPLSACIIAFNEADRIEDCIRSVDFCDDIVVVDSGSTDATRELAAALGARVIEREWPGHVAQKEFAVRAARHDWVLCVDADERISPELALEIRSLQSDGFSGERQAPAGWSMPRLTWWMGQPIRYGTWYPNRQLRLFDRRRGHWGGHDPHDRVILDGDFDQQRGLLAGDLLHHSYRDLDDHLATIAKLTAVAAAGLHARGRRARLGDLWLRPAVRFVRFYFLKRGFLLGWRGLALAFLAAHYVRLKYLRLRILQAQA
ncbi:MAG: glycosyltransferase family 2 protein [Planctomycetota bacterium]|nr:MAG: glycosyltransferase family 2 protein [Planctomycetota bacterium]